MNPYNILGVSQDASEDEIKKAFKEQARKWHPDVNKDEGAEEKFKEVNEAYQTLTNKSNQHNFGGFESGGFGGFDIEDFFRKSQANTVRNVGYIAITLDEVMSGAQKAIDMTHNSPCGDCKGAGLKLSDKICPDCNGTGGTQVQRGIMTIMTQCNSCGATGKKIESICKSCNGSKTHTTIEKIDITIPIGSRHGSTIAIKDNYVATITHKEHPLFKKLDHLNLIQVREIEWIDALLGYSLDVQTLNGNKKMKLNPVVQQDATLRMKEMGLVDANGNKGHMFVKIQINMPKELSEKQIKLLKEIRRENDKRES